MRSFIIIGVALASLAAANAAGAQPQSAVDRPEREAVSLVTKIDFARPGGVQAVYDQLARAAAAACDSGRAHDLGADAADRACAVEALNGAVRSIDRPALTALHTGVTITRLASR